VCALGCVRGYAGACEYVRVAFMIQHATRMRHIVLSFVASIALQHFSTLSLKRQNLKKKKLLNIISALIFSTILSKTFLTLRRNQRDIVTNLKNSSCKVPVILFIF
jgi:predicted neutral ceramidase superfamily lipid hydrolase